MPVVVLFYQENDLGMKEIFILKAIYSFSIVGLEIPSGWMADVLGRKKTLIIGAVLGSAGIMMYSFSYGFWAFAIAEIILGAGNSFVSGADSALLYESLKSEGKQKDYVRHEGQITSAGNFAEAIAGIAAGFLAAISLRAPFYVQFIVTSLAIPAAFTLSESNIKQAAQFKSLKLFANQIRPIFNNNSELRIAVMLSALTGSATLTFAWLVQPFLKAINLPVEFFGVVWTVLNLSVGVSSALAFALEGKFKRQKEILIIILILTAGYLFSGFFISREGIIFLFLFYLGRGLATPIFKNYINQHTPNQMRATILSVRNLIIRILFATTGPFWGWISDEISLNLAFILAGLLYFLSTVVAVWPWIKRSKS